MNFQQGMPSHIDKLSASMALDGCLTVYVCNPNKHTIYFDLEETQVIREMLTVATWDKMFATMVGLGKEKE